MSTKDLSIIITLCLGQILMIINYNDEFRKQLSCYKTRRISMSVLFVMALLCIKIPIIYYSIAAFYVMYLFVMCKPITRAVLSELNLIILSQTYDKMGWSIAHIIVMMLCTVYLESKINTKELTPKPGNSEA